MAIVTGRGFAGERRGRDTVLRFQSGSDKSLLPSCVLLFLLCAENDEKAFMRSDILEMVVDPIQVGRSSQLIRPREKSRLMISHCPAVIG